jgi:hypothetical protein
MLPAMITTLSLPTTLVTSITMDDFISITSEFEDAKHLAYKEGVVILEELPWGAHERIINIVGDHITRAVDGVFGRRCVEELGAANIVYGTSVIQPDTAFRPFNPGMCKSYLL